MEKVGGKSQACSDGFGYRRHFSTDKSCAGTREISASHLKFLPLVPRFSLFVLPQGAVKPAQVYHGDMVSWAQTDGLPVVGHSSLWSPWRTKRLLNWCLRKILPQIQHEAMLWVFYQLLSGTILRKKFGKKRCFQVMSESRQMSKVWHGAEKLCTVHGTLTPPQFYGPGEG